MHRQPILSPTKALLITNIFVIISLAMALIGSRFGVEIFDGWLRLSPILTGLFAVGAAFLAARASAPGEARPWQVLCVGLSLWVVAELLWALSAQVMTTTALRESDWLWVLGYVPVSVAIQLQLNRSRANLRWFKAAFTILVGLAFAALFTSLVLSPLYESTPLSRGLTTTLNLLYPALDITLMIGSLLILQSSSGSSPWRVVAIAILFWVYADLGYAVLNWLGTYGINGLTLFSVEIPYNLAYLLVGAACLQAVSIAHTRQAEAPGTMQTA